jgi:predicted nucleic acid-binding protein
MFLVDSSAWAEYLRESGSLPHRAVVAAVVDGAAATADPIVLEVLAGTAGPNVGRVSQLLASRRCLRQDPHVDVRAAADIYHACRRGGDTPRSSIDLIAAIAIRPGVAVLHRDRDFDLIARHTSLQVSGG